MAMLVYQMVVYIHIMDSDPRITTVIYSGLLLSDIHGQDPILRSKINCPLLW
jgi:hypothetical protein